MKVYDSSLLGLYAADLDGICEALEGEIIRDVSPGAAIGAMILLLDSGREVRLIPRDGGYIEVEIIEAGEPPDIPQEGMLGLF